MAIDTIIEWASKQPDWQRDALRRVALSSEFADADTSTILANLKRAKGLPPEGALLSESLKKEHLQSDARKAPLAHLCSIDNVRNANRLAPGQALPFALKEGLNKCLLHFSDAQGESALSALLTFSVTYSHRKWWHIPVPREPLINQRFLNGITLIYGHNGSGKSGYCRILKKFCRAIVKDTIHPDVFAAGKPPPAEARIRYRLENATAVSETTWRDGEDGPSDVAHLSVFDSHNARLYVDERNRIDYLPYEIELLTRFGHLLTSLQEILSTEISVVDQRLAVGLPTGYTPGTVVSAIVSRLTSKTPFAELPGIEGIDALGKWTDGLAQDLETLKKTIGSDPKALADRCRRVQAVVSNLIEELTKARDALSQDKATQLELAVRNARTTAGAASLAATTLFKDEPLTHVGSDP